MRSVEVSRRTVLKGAVTGAAAAGVAGTVGAAPAAAEVAAGLGLSDDFVLHLLRRATFGATPELVADVRERGWLTWLDEQLACNPATNPDSTWASIAGSFPPLAMTAFEVHRTYESWPWWPQHDTRGGVATRAVYTVWQLREVLVEFWSNHFNTSLGGGDVVMGWTKSTEDREVVTRHALGRFSDLLLASAQSPAMIWYLDNVSNGVGGKINENYARELLELHTLGADAFYADNAEAEASVAAAARVLSGWWADFTWVRSKAKFGDHLYHYKPEYHLADDGGPVFGWTASAGEVGEARGISLLRHLALHPATARHVCRKLCAHFVADDPPASVVDRAVAAYFASDTSIAATVRAILTSPEFAASSGSKWRRPVEYVTAAIRALGIAYDPTKTNSWTEMTTEPTTGLPVWSYHAGPSSGGQKIVSLLSTLDQQTFGYRTPDGYPYEPEAWVHAAAMLRRWNVAHSILTDTEKDGLHPPPTVAELAGVGTTGSVPAGVAVDALTVRLCGQTFDATHRAALLTVLAKGAGDPVTATYLNSAKGREVVALILSSAYFQLR